MSVPFDFEPEFPEILVEWNAPTMSPEPFDSRAEALPAKRWEKGYGDENVMAAACEWFVVKVCLWFIKVRESTRIPFEVKISEQYSLISFHLTGWREKIESVFSWVLYKKLCLRLACKQAPPVRTENIRKVKRSGWDSAPLKTLFSSGIYPPLLI